MRNFLRNFESAIRILTFRNERIVVCDCEFFSFSGFNLTCSADFPDSGCIFKKFHQYTIQFFIPLFVNDGKEKILSGLKNSMKRNVDGIASYIRKPRPIGFKLISYPVAAYLARLYEKYSRLFKRKRAKSRPQNRE